MKPSAIPLPREIHTVFLDRDGVLNEKMPEGRYVTRWEEFRVLPGVPEALARLNQEGIRILVVSNQRGIAKHLYTSTDLDTLHARFQHLLRGWGAHVDGFFVCPHDLDECDCRKPHTGLYQQARAFFPEIAPERSVMIGDSLSDMQFARRLGMASLLIEAEPGRRRPGAAQARKLATACVASLPAALDALLVARRTANS